MTPLDELAELEAQLVDPRVAEDHDRRFVLATLAAGAAVRADRPFAAADHLGTAWALRRRASADAGVVQALEILLDSSLAADRPSDAARARSLRDAARARLGRALDPPPDPPWPLEGLDLLGPLGRGGMGEVWEGVHPATGTRVAVKLVHADASGADALRSEIRRVAALDHPNVVPLLDSGEVDDDLARLSAGLLRAGTPWFAMPLCAGGSLDPWCGRLGWAAVRALLLDLLAGLGHAHARGVLHLDVKPANVLLPGPGPRDGGAALADFGIARALAEGSGERRVAGTRAFMAPEQLAGRTRDFGPWTDLYAVAGLAWALLVGEPPHGLARSVHAGLPPLPPKVRVTPEVADWVAWLGAAAEPDRPGSVREAREALEHLPERESIGAELARRAPLASTSTAPGATTFVWADPAPPSGASAEEAPAATSNPRPASRLSERRPPERLALPPPGLGIAALPHRRPALCGRDAELDALWRALHDAEGGAAVTLRIEGPSGSGRSALLRWLVEQARAAGFAVVAPGGVTDARAALASFVRAEGLPGGARRDRAARAWALARAVEGLEPAIRALGSDRDEPLLVAEALGGLATAGPVLLALDDLDRAPQLRPLAHEARRHPRVLVAAVASEPLEGERVVRVAPLSEVELARLVHATIVASPALAARLAGAAAGQPGFVLDVLARWSEAGLLWSGPEGIAPLGRHEPEPPQTGAALAEARIAALAGDLPGARAALELLAALGPAATVEEWLEATAGAGVPVAAELRDRLARAGHAAALPRDLAEHLVRELERTGALPTAARHALRAVPEGPGHHPRRAELLLAAGERGRAFVAWVDAASESRSSPAVALELLDRAERIADAASPDERARARLFRCEMLHEGERVAEALPLVTRDVPDDPSWRARFAHVEVRIRRRLRDLPGAADAARRFLALADLAHPDEVVTARHVIALVHLDQGELAEAEALLRPIVSPDRPSVTYDLARVLRLRGELAEARAILLSVRPADPTSAARMALQLALVAGAAGDPQEARARFEEVLRTAPPRSSEANVATLWLAAMAEAEGRLTEALSHVLPLVEGARRGSLSVAVAATAHEPAGRCDAWIAALLPPFTPEDRAALGRALGRARAAGHLERARELERVLA